MASEEKTQAEVIAEKTEEVRAANAKIVKDRRDQVADGLTTFLSQLEEGNVRCLAIVAVMKDGRDYHALHLEEGSSSPEVIGLGVRVTQLVEGARRGQ